MAGHDGLGRFAAGSRTAFTYDGVGQLKTVVLPTGETVTCEYYAAHRLTDIDPAPTFRTPEQSSPRPLGVMLPTPCRLGQ